MSIAELQAQFNGLNESGSRAFLVFPSWLDLGIVDQWKVVAANDAGFWVMWGGLFPDQLGQQGTHVTHVLQMATANAVQPLKLVDDDDQELITEPLQGDDIQTWTNFQKLKQSQPERYGSTSQLRQLVGAYELYYGFPTATELAPEIKALAAVDRK